MQQSNEYWMMLLQLIVFLPFILFLIYIIGRIGKKTFPALSGSKYMKIIDRMALSKDNSIMIVQMGEKYYLMSSCNGRVEILKEISGDEMKKYNITQESNVHRNTINEYINKLRNKKED